MREPNRNFFAHVSCEEKIIAWQSLVWLWGQFLKALVSPSLQNFCLEFYGKRRVSKNNLVKFWSLYHCYLGLKKIIRADIVSVKYFLCFQKRIMIPSLQASWLRRSFATGYAKFEIVCGHRFGLWWEYFASFHASLTSVIVEIQAWLPIWTQSLYKQGPRVL